MFILQCIYSARAGSIGERRCSGIERHVCELYNQLKASARWVVVGGRGWGEGGQAKTLQSGISGDVLGLLMKRALRRLPNIVPLGR